MEANRRGSTALRVLLAAICLLISGFATTGRAQERPPAALGRVSTLGDISEVQRTIIANRLEGFLTRAYDLVPRDVYLRAEEAAFQALDVAQCTEEQCIRKIQELLQVERLFVLQILREQELTQLTLTLIRAESKRVVERVCKKCDLAELYDEIEELVEDLIEEDRRIDRAMAGREGGPRIPLEVAQQEEVASVLPTVLLWSGIGLGLFAISEFLDASDLHDQAESAALSEPAKSTQLEDDRDSTASAALAAGVVAAGLLTWWLLTGDEQASARTDGWRLAPILAANGTPFSPGFDISRRW
ncbi:MAG: hypothetical protein IIA14_16605 [SAR324 cluster bacterium]|nr:hypothetical protein [SAR324 cluster bacterium]